MEEELKLPEPHAWLEIDEDELGRPIYKAVHWTAEAINGAHRRSPVYTPEQVRQAVLAERERIERSPVVQFLCGAEEMDGVWFGEEPPEGKPRYWWRSLLRAAIRKG